MKKKLTRVEKNELTRKNIFDAAVEVVGQIGYRDTSITDITTRARIAQGTFYNYFESRQDILDQLLPELGEELLEFLGVQVGGATFLEREEKSIRAYFQFIRNKPEFYRILVEAQVYAPESFDTHADNLLDNYRIALQRTKENGFLQDYSEQEFEAIALMLLGARVYLSRQYCLKNGKATAVPERVVQTYMKMISGGLGQGAARMSMKARRSKASAATEPCYDCSTIRATDEDFSSIYTLSQPLPQGAGPAANFIVQQIVSDFTRRTTEHFMGGEASITSMMLQMGAQREAQVIRASCRSEKLSETEGILHIRLSDDSAENPHHMASCQVFLRSGRPGG